jgi:hypothetical protein
MNWKEKLHKWFPDNKDLSEKKLRKDKKLWVLAQFGWLFTGVVFALILGSVHRLSDSFQMLAVTGACAGGTGLSMAMYAQYRVLEVEVNFELRLREALAAKPQSD